MSDHGDDSSNGTSYPDEIREAMEAVEDEELGRAGDWFERFGQSIEKREGGATERSEKYRLLGVLHRLGARSVDGLDLARALAVERGAHPELPEKNRHEILHMLVLVAFDRESLDEIRRLIDRTAEVAERNGRREDQKRLFQVRGRLALRRGDWSGAESWFVRSLRADDDFGGMPEYCTRSIDVKSLIGLFQAGCTETLASQIDGKLEADYCPGCFFDRSQLRLLRERNSGEPDLELVANLARESAAALTRADVGAMYDPLREFVFRSMLVAGEAERASWLWARHREESDRESLPLRLLEADIEVFRALDAGETRDLDCRFGGYGEPTPAEASVADPRDSASSTDADESRAERVLLELREYADAEDERLSTNMHRLAVDRRLQRLEPLHRAERADSVPSTSG